MIDTSLTVRTALSKAIVRLHLAHTDAPRTTAQLLLASLLNQPKEWLIAHDDEALTIDVLTRYERQLARVAAHEPLAYILGHREFYGLDFMVDKRVLIPRPETEMLVELTLAALKPLVASPPHLPTPLSHSPLAIDIGTGSGAIPVSLAKTQPDLYLIATDVSPDALAVAQLNAQKHGVAERIVFQQRNLLDQIDPSQLKEVRVLTANLPYVTREEIDDLQPEILDHEPRVALDGGDDGLDLIRRLLTQIRDLRARGELPRLSAAFLEFGASQGPTVLATAQQIFPNTECAILRDLAKLDRVLVVRLEP